jgi:hypothetical protein
MTVETVGNNVIFQFVEKSIYGRFVNEHHGGILISSEDTYQTNLPRWGKATHVGPECTDVKPGDYIMIEPGKWTTGFTVDNIRYWKTDESMVMATSNEPGTTF